MLNLCVCLCVYVYVHKIPLNFLTFHYIHLNIHSCTLDLIFTIETPFTIQMVTKMNNNNMFIHIRGVNNGIEIFEICIYTYIYNHNPINNLSVVVRVSERLGLGLW